MDLLPMNQHDRTTLHKEVYFHELDTKDKIIGKIQLSLGVTTTIFAFIVYLGKSASFQFDTATHIVYWIFYFVALSMLVVGVICLISSSWGHTYKIIPTPKEIETYHTQLQDTYKGRDDETLLVDKYFMGFLLEKYTECATANIRINNDRLEHIHYSMTWIFLSIIPTGLSSAILFSSDIEPKNEDTIKVEIVNAGNKKL